jgi:hypothetical protein
MYRITAVLLLMLSSMEAWSQKQEVERRYRQFFPGGECNKNAFSYAWQGYSILKRQGLLANPRYLTIVDYTKPSDRRRLFVLDLDNQHTVISSLTSHGIGSDPDSTTVPYRFSNRNGSKATSLGFYITGDTYTNFRPLDSVGLCLFGLDKGYNDSAAVREVVLHYGATEHSGRVYVTDSGAARSYGCPALPLSTNSRIINLIKGGSCLFIYSARDTKYPGRSTVLNGGVRGAIIQQGPPPNNCSCNLQPKQEN